MTKIPAPLSGMHPWKLYLFFGPGAHDRIMLPYESPHSEKFMVLEEFANWLNADDVPDVIIWGDCLVRRSAIIRVDADKG
jgi:hypothetical protein